MFTPVQRRGPTQGAGLYKVTAGSARPPQEMYVGAGTGMPPLGQAGKS